MERFPILFQAPKNTIFVDGKEIASLSVQNPEDIPWSNFGVDVVLESTGNAKTEALAKTSRRICAKCSRFCSHEDSTPHICYGRNDEHFEKRFRRQQCELYYELYCSILRVLLDHFTIENVFVSSIHSITDSQNLLDNSGRDLRRALKCYGKNVIPTTTGSIVAIGLILPELHGKIDGLAFRVPIPTVSLCDMRLYFKKKPVRKK